MFKEFLSSLLYEILHFAAKHGEFFNESKEKRLTHLEAIKIPAPFKNFLSEAKDADFFDDVKTLMKYLNGVELTSLEANKSEFFKAIAEFFSTQLASKIDELPLSFYLDSEKKQRDRLDELLNSDSQLARALKNLLLLNSYQELASQIDEFSRVVIAKDYIVLQSPREIPSELRKEIRKKLFEEHPYSFPIFQINRNLIGGLRIFINGKSVDNSWFSRIVGLTSIRS